MTRVAASPRSLSPFLLSSSLPIILPTSPTVLVYQRGAQGKIRSWMASSSSYSSSSSPTVQCTGVPSSSSSSSLLRPTVSLRAPAMRAFSPLVALLVAGEGGVGRVVAVGGACAVAGLAVEHLAEQVEEGQQLLHAADHVEGQRQVARLPGQGPGGAVLLGLGQSDHVGFKLSLVVSSPATDGPDVLKDGRERRTRHRTREEEVPLPSRPSGQTGNTPRYVFVGCELLLHEKKHLNLQGNTGRIRV
ncbi:hypothetical protein EYF80_032092 [Liparis tanakae]|uniref:Uncharacterized protein n=1 Tax=Liparis tanakae TaxID=230148 RepID=A0A4Z2GYN6_9TELE|nr:hypothetical protein EYF80_032092 [Liparis tanakae]